MPRYAALLRAISNVAMEPFRRGLQELGFSDVSSYGMSGNFVFTAPASTRATIERQIAARFGTKAFVRTRQELARVVSQDPIHAGVIFLARAPSPSRRKAFQQLAFEDPVPVLKGTTVYFRYPARVRGTRTPFDFERALDVAGTARSSRVVESLLDLISKAPGTSL